MKNIWSTTLFLSIVIFSSCKKEEPKEEVPITTQAVLIGSEGQLTGSTGSLAAYEPKTKTVNLNVFQKANTYIMGNTLQSMLVEKDKIFLVVNGTGEILVIDRNSYEVKKRIKGLGAPRYIMKVAEDKYYITDWQSEGVQIYYHNTGTLSKTILTGKGPEGMAVYENMAFIANGGDGNPDSNLTVINTDVDTILAQIKVGYNPNSVQIDKDNKLWVLCSGIRDQNPFNSISGNLVSFDLDMDSLVYKMDSLLIVDSLVISDNQMRPVKLQKSKEGDMLYWLDNKTEANLMSFNVFSTASPTTSPFIPGSFYGVGVDPVEGDIYLSNTLGGTGNGEVSRYDASGAQQDLFKVGINPGCFGFK